MICAVPAYCANWAISTNEHPNDGCSFVRWWVKCSRTTHRRRGDFMRKTARPDKSVQRRLGFAADEYRAFRGPAESSASHQGRSTAYPRRITSPKNATAQKPCTEPSACITCTRKPVVDASINRRNQLRTVCSPAAQHHPNLPEKYEFSDTTMPKYSIRYKKSKGKFCPEGGKRRKPHGKL